MQKAREPESESIINTNATLEKPERQNDWQRDKENRVDVRRLYSGFPLWWCGRGYRACACGDQVKSPNETVCLIQAPLVDFSVKPSALPFSFRAALGVERRQDARAMSALHEFGGRMGRKCEHYCKSGFSHTLHHLKPDQSLSSSRVSTRVPLYSWWKRITHKDVEAMCTTDAQITEHPFYGNGSFSLNESSM